MENGLDGRVYALGPRIPPARPRVQVRTMTSTLGFRVPSPILVARAEEDCPDPRLCEKPVSSSSLTLPIALGVA